VVLALVAVSSAPAQVLFGLFVVYGISGPVTYLWRRAQGRPVSMVQITPDTDDAAHG